MLEQTLEKFIIQKYYTDTTSPASTYSVKEIPTLKYFHINKHLNNLSKKDTLYACRCILRMMQMIKGINRAIVAFKEKHQRHVNTCENDTIHQIVESLSVLLAKKDELFSYLEKLLYETVNYVPKMDDFYSVVEPVRDFISLCNDVLLSNHNIDSKKRKMAYLLSNVYVFIADMHLYILEMHNSDELEEYMNALTDTILLLYPDYDDQDPYTHNVYDTLKNRFFDIDDFEELIPIYEWHTLLTEFKGRYSNYEELVSAFYH